MLSRSISVGLIIFGLITSFVIFEVEHEAQPDIFTNVFQTMWWAVATLTTVGYGDMYPITAAGKMITTVIAIIGIGFIAIPGGLFASEFISALAVKKEKNNKKEKCLNCGSENIKKFKDPILECNSERKNYDTAILCDDCQFTWMEKK